MISKIDKTSSAELEFEQTNLGMIIVILFFKKLNCSIGVHAIKNNLNDLFFDVVNQIPEEYFHQENRGLFLDLFKVKYSKMYSKIKKKKLYF